MVGEIFFVSGTPAWTLAGVLLWAVGVGLLLAAKTAANTPFLGQQAFAAGEGERDLDVILEDRFARGEIEMDELEEEIRRAA